jgi:hypothetical protein
MAGILWPRGTQKDNVSTGSSFRCKCSDLSFSGNREGVGHTSKVELALFERVEVGERVGDQLCGEPHDGGTLQRLWYEVVVVCYALCWYAQRRSRIYVNLKVCALEGKSNIGCDRRGSKVWPQSHLFASDIPFTSEKHMIDFTSLHRHNLTSSAYLITVASSGQDARLLPIVTHVQGSGCRPKECEAQKSLNGTFLHTTTGQDQDHGCSHLIHITAAISDSQ